MLLFPAPLPAFRCYADHLTTTDTSLKTRLYNWSRGHQPISDWKTLLSIQQCVTITEGKDYNPHFVDLILKWIELTKPSFSDVESVWKTVSKNGGFRSCWNLNYDFKGYIIGNYGKDLQYFRDNHFLSAGSASYMLWSYNPVEMFEKVNQTGHFVIPCCNSDCQITNCPEFEKCQQYFTLTVEYGYYVIRDSTVLECHEMCTLDNCNDAATCPTTRHTHKNSVLFYWINEMNMSRPLIGGFISLFFNSKKVVDERLEKLFKSKDTRIEIHVMINPHHID